MANRKTDKVEGGPKGRVRIERMRVRKRMGERGKQIEDEREKEGKE